MPSRRQRRIIEGKVWTHSGGMPRTKLKARNLAAELRQGTAKTGRLNARVLPSIIREGRFDVYVRRKR